jgi:hypothetical protein
LLPKESAMPTFPDVRVGEPCRHEALGVFPLFAEPRSPVPYLLSHEALADRLIQITEVSGGGSVPNLLVDNRADARVLFLEGEELRGAKQNRVLNASVLVAPRSTTTIPVSCVEHGRWHYQSPEPRCGDSHASSRLRHVLKKSVYRSTLQGQGHASDQDEVWKEVGRQARSLGSQSPTEAMSDTYEHCQDRLAEFRERLPYVEGASGVAAAVGSNVTSVDLFDQPGTCRKVWDRLLSGLVLDALEAAPAPRSDGVIGMEFDLLEYLICSFWQAAGSVEVLDVEGALAMLHSAPWQPGPAVGAGQEFRAQLGRDRYASALVSGTAVLHASLVMAG